MAFEFAYRLAGGAPTIQQIPQQDAETLTKGDMLNLESGSADLAATNDSALLGVALESNLNGAAGDLIAVIIDPDAVYRVTDANRRRLGDLLDVSGATGAQTVAADTNTEFIVVADTSATEPTYVQIAKHSNWLLGTAVA